MKLAAMEALFETTADAPESIGGVVIDGELRGAIEIPCGLSFLIAFNCDYVVEGLDSVPPDDRPNPNIVHTAFDVMVGIGTALFGLSAWFGFARWRRKRQGKPWSGSKWFYRAAVLSGPAAVVALISGWVVTEVGRQPWIVYEVMKTEEAVTTAGGIVYLYAAAWVIYIALSGALIYVLRRLAATPLPPEIEAVQ